MGLAVITQTSDLNLNKNQLIGSVLENRTTAIASPVAGQWYFNTATGTFLGYNGSIWVDFTQSVSSSVKVKGEIANAASNPAYPTVPATGDMYFITTQSGTVGGIAVEIGDQLVYGLTGWFVLQANLIDATTSAKGYMALASIAEGIAGVNNTKAMTPFTTNQVLMSGSYTRKAVSIISLNANTGSVVTHGFNLSDPDLVQVQTWYSGSIIVMGVQSSGSNAVTLCSNTNLSNVKVVCEA